MWCPDAPRRERAQPGIALSEQAGDRLRAYIEGVMADRDIDSVSELARRAHVSRDTFQAWWRGRPPRRATAELVARELGVTYADLISAREGSMAGTVGDSTQAVPAVLIRALEDQTAALNRLVDWLARLAPQAIAAGVADALREAGLNPDDGESPDEPHLEQTG